MITRKTKVESERLHPATHGHARMLATTTGIIGHEFREKVLSEYWQLNSQEARAGFARSWLKVIAIKLKDTIPILYDLAHLVREHNLYKTEQFSDAEVFATFEEYWTARFDGVMQIWLKHESADPLFSGLTSPHVDHHDGIPEGSISVAEAIGLDEIASEVTEAITARMQCP